MASSYTSSYQLCQWEGTDKVLRTDFNGDNQKIDAALAGLAAGQGTLESGLEELEAGLASEVSARTAAVNALNQKFALKQLKTATLAEQSTSFSIDLPAIDWSQWRAIHIIAELNGSVSLRPGFNTDYLTNLAVSAGRRAHFIILSLFGECEEVRGLLLHSGIQLFGSETQLQLLNQFSLAQAYGTGGTLEAGSKITVKGEY